MSDQEFQDYLRQCNWAMRAQMDQNEKEFRLSTYPRFDWDQWRGELVFSAAGTPKVVARIQIVGTLGSKSGAWFWAWANSGVLEAVRQSVLRTRNYGNEQGIQRLIQPKWAAKESDAWEMTALTFRLTDAKGAFKCTSPEGSTFVVFTDIRTVSDRKRLFGARTCAHVLNDARAILLVSRELDGEVLAVCGDEDDNAQTTRDLPLDRLLNLDPSLLPLAAMPDGWVAMRESSDDDWVRSKAE